MILILSINGEHNLIGLYKTKEDFFQKYWKVKNNNRKDILQQLDSILEKNNLNIKDIKKIYVYRGPGSLTSLRVGISIANTLAWALDIPIFGFTGKKYNQKNNVLDIVKHFNITSKKSIDTSFNKIIQPYYSTSLS